MALLDKSGANISAIMVYNRRSFSKIKISTCKYLNNIVEQDHRFIKRRTMQGLSFKEFESARRTLGGIELIRMLQKDQMHNPGKSTYESFLSLAA